MSETQEQEKLRSDLIAQYGERAFRQACELAGIKNCLQALSCDALSTDERAAAYMRASLHLGQFLESLMSAEQSASLTECARRVEAAVDQWMLDDIERRQGLPQP
jgi:hypothetical protein